MNIISILYAGLVNSVNPCALAVIVFFAGFIFFAEYSYKKILLFGNLFIISIFLTSFLVEYGMFEAFQRLVLFEVIAHATYVFLGILAVALGLLNFYDWCVHKKTDDPQRSIFKALARTGSKTGQWIDEEGSRRSKRIHLATLSLAGVLIGFFMGIVGAIGRGFLYFPFATQVLISRGFKMKAIGFLVLYNAGLILPLFGVFIILLRLARHRDIKDFAKVYFSKVKIIGSAVFLGLGFGLLYMFF